MSEVSLKKCIIETLQYFNAYFFLGLVPRTHLPVFSTFSASMLVVDGGDADNDGDATATARGGAPWLGRAFSARVRMSVVMAYMRYAHDDRRV